MKRYYFLVLFTFFLCGASHRVKSAKTFDDVCLLVMYEARVENLTCKLVTQAIVCAPNEDVRLMTTCVDMIKDGCMSLVRKILKRPDEATDKKLENALALVGILRWAELEVRQPKYQVETALKRLTLLQKKRTLLKE